MINHDSANGLESHVVFFKKKKICVLNALNPPPVVQIKLAQGGIQASVSFQSSREISHNDILKCSEKWMKLEK